MEYEYDERELLVKETYYNTDGSLSYYLTYEYNENNKNTALYETLVSICDTEQDNGVKNQYVKALKKIKR